MVGFIKRLLRGPEEPEDPRVIEPIFEIKTQFDDIHSQVQNGLKSQLVEEQIAAVDKALKELPRLGQRIEALPPFKSERRQQYFTYFVNAVTSYELFCKHCKASLENNDQWEAATAMRHLKEATRLLKEAQKIIKM